MGSNSRNRRRRKEGERCPEHPAIPEQMKYNSVLMLQRQGFIHFDERRLSRAKLLATFERELRPVVKLKRIRRVFPRPISLIDLTSVDPHVPDSFSEVTEDSLQPTFHDTPVYSQLDATWSTQESQGTHHKDIPNSVVNSTDIADNPFQRRVVPFDQGRVSSESIQTSGTIDGVETYPTAGVTPPRENHKPCEDMTSEIMTAGRRPSLSPSLAEAGMIASQPNDASHSNEAEEKSTEWSVSDDEGAPVFTTDKGVEEITSGSEMQHSSQTTMQEKSQHEILKSGNGDGIHKETLSMTYPPRLPSPERDEGCAIEDSIPQNTGFTDRKKLLGLAMSLLFVQSAVNESLQHEVMAKQTLETDKTHSPSAENPSHFSPVHCEDYAEYQECEEYQDEPHEVFEKTNEGPALCSTNSQCESPSSSSDICGSGSILDAVESWFSDRSISPQSISSQSSQEITEEQSGVVTIDEIPDDINDTMTKEVEEAGTAICQEILQKMLDAPSGGVLMKDNSYSNSAKSLGSTLTPLRIKLLTKNVDKSPVQKLRIRKVKRRGKGTWTVFKMQQPWRDRRRKRPREDDGNLSDDSLPEMQPPNTKRRQVRQQQEEKAKLEKIADFLKHTSRGSRKTTFEQRRKRVSEMRRSRKRCVEKKLKCSDCAQKKKRRASSQKTCTSLLRKNDIQLRPINEVFFNAERDNSLSPINIVPSFNPETTRLSTYPAQTEVSTQKEQMYVDSSPMRRASGGMHGGDDHTRYTEVPNDGTQEKLDLPSWNIRHSASEYRYEDISDADVPEKPTAVTYVTNLVEKPVPITNDAWQEVTPNHKRKPAPIHQIVPNQSPSPVDSIDLDFASVTSSKNALSKRRTEADHPPQETQIDGEARICGYEHNPRTAQQLHHNLFPHSSQSCSGISTNAATMKTGCSTTTSNHTEDGPSAQITIACPRNVQPIPADHRLYGQSSKVSLRNYIDGSISAEFSKGSKFAMNPESRPTHKTNEPKESGSQGVDNSTSKVSSKSIDVVPATNTADYQIAEETEESLIFQNRHSTQQRISMPEDRYCQPVQVDFSQSMPSSSNLAPTNEQLETDTSLPISSSLSLNHNLPGNDVPATTFSGLTSFENSSCPPVSYSSSCPTTFQSFTCDTQPASSVKRKPTKKKARKNRTLDSDETLIETCHKGKTAGSLTKITGKRPEVSANKTTTVLDMHTGEITNLTNTFNSPSCTEPEQVQPALHPSYTIKPQQTQDSEARPTQEIENVEQTKESQCFNLRPSEFNTSSQQEQPSSIMPLQQMVDQQQQCQQDLHHLLHRRQQELQQQRTVERQILYQRQRKLQALHRQARKQEQMVKQRRVLLQQQQQQRYQYLQIVPVQSQPHLQGMPPGNTSYQIPQQQLVGDQGTLNPHPGIPICPAGSTASPVVHPTPTATSNIAASVAASLPGIANVTHQWTDANMGNAVPVQIQGQDVPNQSMGVIQALKQTRCNHCRSTGAKFLCSACQKVWYCDKVCQSFGWKNSHWKICKLLK